MELYSGRRQPHVRMCCQTHFFTKSLNVGLSFFHRYIGEGYSQAQESMEDEMREFYGLKQSTPSPLQSPSSGQLVAVRAEEEEEILRAQVCEVMVDKVKVRDQGEASHDSLSMVSRQTHHCVYGHTICWMFKIWDIFVSHILSEQCVFPGGVVIAS